MNQGKEVAIIAGASGLVGNELIHQLLDHELFSTVYSLSRHELPLRSKKLVQLTDPQLRITAWSDSQPVPKYGFICLGTTLKQAGSKSALEAVDYQLVKDVASAMHMLGVTTLVVVSSLLAHPHIPSHYLRCKGRMEQAVGKMGFKRVIFVRPGPLKGERNTPRPDEILLQRSLNIIKPLMIGPLSHFKPIRAEHVASAMLNAALEPERLDNQGVKIISGNALRP